jgi:hypothetical protein
VDEPAVDPPAEPVESVGGAEVEPADEPPLAGVLPATVPPESGVLPPTEEPGLLLSDGVPPEVSETAGGGVATTPLPVSVGELTAVEPPVSDEPELELSGVELEWCVALCWEASDGGLRLPPTGGVTVGMLRGTWSVVAVGVAPPQAVSPALASSASATAATGRACSVIRTAAPCGVRRSGTR